MHSFYQMISGHPGDSPNLMGWWGMFFLGAFEPNRQWQSILSKQVLMLSIRNKIYIIYVIIYLHLISIYISMTTKMTTYVDRQPPLERCPVHHWPMAWDPSTVAASTRTAWVIGSENRSGFWMAFGTRKMVDNYPPYLKCPRKLANDWECVKTQIYSIYKYGYNPFIIPFANFLGHPSKTNSKFPHWK